MTTQERDTQTRQNSQPPLTLGVDDRDALSPFRVGPDGAWTRSLAAHLARRGGFWRSPAVVARLVELGPSAAVDSLFEWEDDAIALRLLDTARAVNDVSAAQAWWIHRMLHTKSLLREKVALFWHGHFATSNKKVDNARLMLDQLLLFRT